jgi:hypothetical protein
LGERGGWEQESDWGKWGLGEQGGLDFGVGVGEEEEGGGGEGACGVRAPMPGGFCAAAAIKTCPRTLS